MKKLINLLIYYFLNIIKKIIKLLIYFFAFLIFIIPSLFLRVLKIRFVYIKWPDAIGHVVYDTDLYIREMKILKNYSYSPILLLPKNKIANVHYINYLKKDFIVITNIFFTYFLFFFSRIFFSSFDTDKYATNQNTTNIEKFKKASKDLNSYKIISQTYDDLDLFYKLSPLDESYSSILFSKMSLDKYKWYVTLHFRDRFFRSQTPGPRDTKNILSYLPLIEEIISRGGAVVRMGRGTILDKLPKISGLIDYPFSNFASDRNDIILCAKSRMFFGTNSGLCTVPFKFNVPVSLCNYIPFAKISDFPGQYYYLKVLKNKKTNDYVSFKEVLNSQAANSIDFLDYENCNYSIIDNSAEEIKDFFIESFNRLNNQYIESLEEKKLRERFNNLRKQSPFYYEGGGKISGVFLKKYSFLF